MDVIELKWLCLTVKIELTQLQRKSARERERERNTPYIVIGAYNFYSNEAIFNFNYKLIYFFLRYAYVYCHALIENLYKQASNK